MMHSARNIRRNGRNAPARMRFWSGVLVQMAVLQPGAINGARLALGIYQIVGA
jgi:hypothetical protein